MKLATIRRTGQTGQTGQSGQTDEGGRRDEAGRPDVTGQPDTVAVRVDGVHAVELAEPDVGRLLARPDWRQYAAAAAGPRHNVAGLDYAPVVPHPGKIICVGLNYRQHITEMGRPLPEYPTLFAKYAEALIGAYDPIMLPPESAQVDWEAELGVIVGATVRHADRAQAAAAIAGYTVANDVTARDWQYRSPQWLQGKTFEATTPLGPWLVTPDEAVAAMPDEAVAATPDEATGGNTADPADRGLALTCRLDGEVVQEADTADLVFDAAELVAYISAIITLRPGDVILTGTPGGVGHARTPARYLAPGSELVTAVAGLGECRNVCRVTA
jgi:acylpyruvate hydrolase